MYLVCHFAPPGSPLAGAIDEWANWTLDTHLAALTLDHMRVKTWRQGNSQGERPAPIKRPGDTPDLAESFSAEPVTLEEALEQRAELHKSWGRDE